MTDQPMFQEAWVRDALHPWKKRRMWVLNKMTKVLFGRDYFCIVGRR